MHDIKVNDLGGELDRVLIPDSALPERIFEDAFDGYLFFDSDVGSSDTLASTLYKVAKECLGVKFQVKVFSASNRSLLGELDENSDWVAQINEIGKALRSVGDCYGLILVDASHKWVVYQARPIDIGILAFNGMTNFPDIESEIKFCFFNSNDIANWLSGKGWEDIGLVSNFGREYLVNLLKNYGGAK